jgi:hypothetical protein
MVTKKMKTDKIEREVAQIFAKSDARVESGCDPVEADWQATLELHIFMMQKHLFANQGQLLPMQIDGQEEWDFYLDIQEKLDLPPDTCALLMTPSAFKSLPVPESFEIDRLDLQETPRNAYSILISDCHAHNKIMQVSLPGLESVGIDVLDDGKHFADYTYYTIEKCLDDLSNITWIFFGTRGQWNEKQIIRYTENWFGKSTFGLNMGEVMFHSEFSYVHHPKLLKLTPLDSIFKLIQATIPKEYDSLEKAIEITNDLNRDMELGEAFVTKTGIMKDNQAECQALIGRIAVEIDMHVENLDGLKGVKMPDRNIRDPKYNRIFDETARRLYKIIVGRECSKSVKIM